MTPPKHQYFCEPDKDSPYILVRVTDWVQGAYVTAISSGWVDDPSVVKWAYSPEDGLNTTAEEATRIAERWGVGIEDEPIAQEHAEQQG